LTWWGTGPGGLGAEVPSGVEGQSPGRGSGGRFNVFLYKILDLMNLRAGLEEYMFSKHAIQKNFEDSMGGGYASGL